MGGCANITIARYEDPPLLDALYEIANGEAEARRAMVSAAVDVLHDVSAWMDKTLSSAPSTLQQRQPHQPQHGRRRKSWTTKRPSTKTLVAYFSNRKHPCTNPVSVGLGDTRSFPTESGAAAADATVAAAAVIDLRLVHNCGPEVTTQALAEMFYILVNDKHIIELVAAEGVVRKLLLLRRYCARMNLIETDYVLRRPWKVRTYVGRWINGWMNG